MTTMRVVGECLFWYRLTRVFPDKFHRAVKRLCVCVLSWWCQITQDDLHTHTHTHKPFYGPLSVTTWVSQYQKQHSPTRTYPDHQPFFISFLHLRSIASSLFSLCAWQSLHNLSPSPFWTGTLHFILHFLTLSLSSFHNSHAHANAHVTILVSACWSATTFYFLTGHISLPYNILLHTQLLYSLPFFVSDIFIW